MFLMPEQNKSHVVDAKFGKKKSSRNDFIWHQQHGFRLVPMWTRWLSKLTTAGKAKRGCVTPIKSQPKHYSVTQWLTTQGNYRTWVWWKYKWLKGTTTQIYVYTKEPFGDCSFWPFPSCLISLKGLVSADFFVREAHLTYYVVTAWQEESGVSSLNK